MSKIDSDTTWGKSCGRPARPTRVRNSGCCGWDVVEGNLACQDPEGKLEMKKDQRGIHSASKPSGDLCRMSSVTERLVVSSPSVCEVWAHRLLRQFFEPACLQACGGDRASDHCQLRAG